MKSDMKLDWAFSIGSMCDRPGLSVYLSYLYIQMMKSFFRVHATCILVHPHAFACIHVHSHASTCIGLMPTTSRPDFTFSKKKFPFACLACIACLA